MPKYASLPVPEGYFVAEIPGGLWIAGRQRWCETKGVLILDSLLRDGETIMYGRRYNAIIACLKDRERPADTPTAE